MNRPIVRLIRTLLRASLRARGYSKGQIAAAMGKLGDGTILEWLRENGPKILEFIKMILPFILMFIGPPEGTPDPEMMAEIEAELGAPLADASVFADSDPA